ncbi:MAG: ABC transporter substrate-binding protein [Acidimicrobiia bacterium]|nr:ABC transporter substrate-binding protein [Acidimicrobiia bacterium]NNL29315.1 ABC transporter substrate-binding protein [Acidimicrobiia bacterium]
MDRRSLIQLRRRIPGLACAALVLFACTADPPATVVDPIASTTSTVPPTSTTDPPTTTLAPVTLGKGFSVEPCGNGLPALGCITLGTITDETGSAQFRAPGYFAGAQAFWASRNSSNGIADAFSVEVLRADKRDAAGDPQAFANALASIEPNVAALSHVVGVAAIEANMSALVNGALVSAPVESWSGWAFVETDVGVVLESGASWCVNGYNAVKSSTGSIGLVSDQTLAARDFSEGARAAAAALNGLVFDVSVTPIAQGGEPSQQSIVAQILSTSPESVVLATGPSEAGAIIGGSVLAGYGGTFTLQESSFTSALVDASSGVRSVFLSDQVRVIGSLAPWDFESPGHERMRFAADAIGVPASARRAFQVGWVSQYPLLAAIDAAVRAQNLDRRGIVSAAASLDHVDYEGMLPDDSPALSSIAFRIDADAPDLFVSEESFFSSEGLPNYFTAPCSDLS